MATSKNKSKKHIQNLIEKLSSQAIFSTLAEDSTSFESPTQKYKAMSLIHNRDMINLSFFCKGVSDNLDYEVTSIIFENKKSRQKMESFLNNLDNIQIPTMIHFHEFYTEDTEDNRYKLILIDKCSHNLTINDVITASSSFEDLREKISSTNFKYSVILTAWETIHELRNIGLKNMGFNTMNINLIEILTEDALANEEIRFENLFSPLNIKLEYKFNHFRKLLIADANRDLTLNELVGFKFFSDKLCAKFKNVTDALKDHFSFILLILEVFLIDTHINFIEYIDFEDKKVDEYLLTQINDPLIKKVIKDCFLDSEFKESNQIFFRENNTIMKILNKFKNIKIENSEISTLSWEIFTKGVKIVPLDRALRFMLIIQEEDFPSDHLKFIAKYHVNSSLLKCAINVLRDYETDYDHQLIIIKCVNFFFQLLFDNIKINVSYLDSRVLKKFIALSFHVFRANYDRIT